MLQKNGDECWTLPVWNTSLPGQALFRWSDHSGTLNVCHAVTLPAANNAMENTAWFSLGELARLPLTPLVNENVSHLLRVAAASDHDAVTSFERELLKLGKLRKKNERVFYACETPTVLGMQLIMLLKELAAYRELPVFRVCLHENDDESIHEMLMIHTRPLSIGPLKQDKTSLSYHMLDGTADILLHDDAGNCIRTIRIDSRDDCGGRFARLKASVFRSIQTVTPYSVFLEVASGPFSDKDTIWLNKQD